jgi:hypothetical protein
MRTRHYLFAIILALLTTTLNAQTTYVPLWAKENWFLTRLEVKAGTNNDLNLSTVKPYMRKAYVEVADSFRSELLAGQNPHKLTKIDQYNLNRFEANSREYSKFTEADFADWKPKKPLLKVFFPTKGNFVEVNTKDFYLTISPVLNFEVGKESNYDKTLYVNSKGASFRGLIAKKIGFDFFLTDNQERGPLQYRQFLADHEQAPGANFWKEFKGDGDDYMMNKDSVRKYAGATDYFDARGSISVNATKYINIQFGYDRNFIGNGYRSLYLSNFAANNLFLKLNTRIWKLNYTNLFMELVNDFQGGSGDRLLDRKYAAMHHLGINVTKWLNVGLFESIIFGRSNHFDFSYLVPVIFLRSIEGNAGSADNANVGFDVKANLFKSLQLYGQVMIDEMNFATIREDNSWWANKTGFQFGLKYIDAVGIKNLDLQVEANRIRPFTYSHRDTVTSYTHYNQNLAHPAGANLLEFVGIARYQPIPKLYLTGKIMTYKQGRDSAGYNFGSDPGRIYNDNRPRDFGFEMFSGIPATTLYGSFVASYEVFENFFADLTVTGRSFSMEGNRTNTSTFSFGIRWNMYKRESDY